MIKVSDYVSRFIADRGVKHVFLLSGGGCMHLLDSIGRESRLEIVANLHEQGAVIAAEAYAQYTNELGVALVTTGPGGTNAVTGVAAAWTDSTPLFVLSGQVKRADLMTARGVRQMGPQEVDIVSIVRPITKYAKTVLEPGDIRLELEKAVHLARSGRPGPVWLDIPLDVQSAKVDEGKLAGYTPPAESGPGAAEIAAAAGKTVALLATAERPAFLAGNGIRLARALPEFHELIEKLGIPVMTTWKSVDFLPEEHPLYAGRPGGVAARGANYTLQNSDFLLMIGARVDLPSSAFNHRNYARAAKKVIVDADPAEIAKFDFQHKEVTLAADARAYLRALLDQAASLAKRDRSAWLERVRDWKKRYPIVLPEFREQKGSVNNYVLVEAIGDAMTPADLFVPGSSGACSEISMQAFRAKKGLRVLNSEGLGPMGFGIAAPLGACLAAGRARTISIDGDGGFQMNAQELETVRRLDLPIKWFVLDNDGYGSIRFTQKNYFEGRLFASAREGGLTLPDSRKVAAAYGIATESIADHAELAAKLPKILSTPGPIVCTVKISTDQPTMPRASSRVKPDGTIVSAPLEDLHPFLDREEFKRNMIIPPLEE